MEFKFQAKIQYNYKSDNVNEYKINNKFIVF